MRADSATGLPGEVHVASTPGAVAATVADFIQERTPAGAVQDTGPFAIALAGGETPRSLYERLSAEPYRHVIAWERWRVYFGDERAVPPDDPRSNLHMASSTLLRHVPIPAHHIHRMRAEAADLDAAAAEYAQRLATTLPAGAAATPRLDLVLLGLGDNGHTASLFPGTSALEVRHTWATRGEADYEPRDRITLTYPTINAAGTVLFMVTGDRKRAALRAVREGTVPAAGVAPHDGELLWFIDAAAAESM